MKMINMNVAIGIIKTMPMETIIKSFKDLGKIKHAFNNVEQLNNTPNNELDILRFLTFKIENRRLSNKIPTFRNKNNGHGWEHVIYIINDVRRTIVDDSRNFGKINSKYEGIYRVPYKELSKEINKLNYNPKLLELYMNIVDEIYQH